MRVCVCVSIYIFINKHNKHMLKYIFLVIILLKTLIHLYNQKLFNFILWNYFMNTIQNLIKFIYLIKNNFF